METTFYSKGKLLLTAEYVVLDGAKALALPTKKGQSLTVKSNQSGILEWNSFDCHQLIWYKTTIKTKDLFSKNPPKGNSKFDETLFKILWEALQANPIFLNKNLGYHINTQLEFERLWGLGTSSTLINNVAQWAKINPFELLNKSFGGSGYDIAAANANTPIFYTRNSDLNNPIVSISDFDPLFKENLFFIYLEEKMDSKEAIKNYKAQSKESLSEVIEKVNIITNQIVNCSNLIEFENLLRTHENIIASILNCNTIQESRFPDYTGGVIKSLGGWGGDFTLVTGTLTDMIYFKEKKYDTIIPYSEMIY